jgi:hypothetical protein
MTITITFNATDKLDCRVTRDLLDFILEKFETPALPDPVWGLSPSGPASSPPGLSSSLPDPASSPPDPASSIPDLPSSLPDLPSLPASSIPDPVAIGSHGVSGVSCGKKGMSVAPLLDSVGTPWDERIHRTTKIKTNKGLWYRKKGTPDKLFIDVMAEITNPVATDAPKNPAATDAPKNPAATDAPTMPHLNLPLSGETSIPLLPQDTPDTVDLIEIDNLLGDLIDSASITVVEVDQILKHFKPGSASINDYAGDIKAQQDLLQYLNSSV